MKMLYRARASNHTDAAEGKMDWYHQLGECSENRIKELKIGFGMGESSMGRKWAMRCFFGLRNGRQYLPILCS